MNFSQQSGFVFFRIIIPTILLLLQVFLYVRFSAWARDVHPERRWLRRTALVLFLLFNGSLIAVMFLRPKVDDVSPWFRLFAMYPFYIWHAASFFLGLVLVALALVKLPFRLAMLIPRAFRSVREKIRHYRHTSRYVRFDASRRQFLRNTTSGLAVVSFGGAAYGVFRGRSDYEVSEAEFSIVGLPPQFDGFSIALVSDIHSSPFMTRPEMEEYAKVVNSLKADIIVIPGDFVTSNTSEVYPFAEAFSMLHAPQGVYGVLGNHDFYVQQPDVVAREVNACGIRLLRDEGLLLSRGSGRLYLAGIDDAWGPDMADRRIRFAREDAPESVPRILLCHRPYFLRQAAEHLFDIVLSGHTHGGQVVLGRFGNAAFTPATLVSPFVAGKYRFGPTQMYVSRGIGTVGLPIRINCPPEITRIVLRAARPTTMS